MAASTKIRVLITKSGFEEHDRGARYVAAKLQAAGMEVIYIPHLFPADVTAAAVQEDVDIVGISSMAGGHLMVAGEVVAGLRHAGRPDVPVIVGGIIPARDRQALSDLGVAGIFGPGTTGDAIVRFVREKVGAREDCKQWQPHR